VSSAAASVLFPILFSFFSASSGPFMLTFALVLLLGHCGQSPWMTKVMRKMTALISFSMLGTPWRNCACLRLSSPLPRNPDPPTSSLEENLYHEAQVTLGAAVATLFVFFLTHRLSKSTFQDLLDILQLLLPSGNLLPKKLDTFLGLFSSVGDRLVFHEFCETCHHLFSLSETRCPKCNTWRYQGSQADQAKKKKKTFFLELPIQRDVEELFKGRLDYFLFYFFKQFCFVFEVPEL